MLGRIFYRFVLLIVCAMAATGCQMTPAQETQSVAASPASVPNIVQGVCGDCHGVEPPFLSPNPLAPDFATIANRQGINEASVTGWLIEAHNYPELMDFELSEKEAGETAKYLIGLREVG